MMNRIWTSRFVNKELSLPDPARHTRPGFRVKGIKTIYCVPFPQAVRCTLSFHKKPEFLVCLKESYVNLISCSPAGGEASKRASRVSCVASPASDLRASPRGGPALEIPDPARHNHPGVRVKKHCVPSLQAVRLPSGPVSPRPSRARPPPPPPHPTARYHQPSEGAHTDESLQGYFTHKKLQPP